MRHDAPEITSAWNGETTRVSYRVYKGPAVPETERKRVFGGSVWNDLCLVTEIPETGDWRAWRGLTGI